MHYSNINIERIGNASSRKSRKRVVSVSRIGDAKKKTSTN
jgi:hypothetical protein